MACKKRWAAVVLTAALVALGACGDKSGSQQADGWENVLTVLAALVHAEGGTATTADPADRTPPTMVTLTLEQTGGPNVTVSQGGHSFQQTVKAGTEFSLFAQATDPEGLEDLQIFVFYDQQQCSAGSDADGDIGTTEHIDNVATPAASFPSSATAGQPAFSARTLRMPVTAKSTPGCTVRLVAWATAVNFSADPASSRTSSAHIRLLVGP